MLNWCDCPCEAVSVKWLCFFSFAVTYLVVFCVTGEDVVMVGWLLMNCFVLFMQLYKSF